MKKTFFMPILTNRRGKCKFTHSCGLYSNASYTCTHTGGSYCGKYRKLSDEPTTDHAKITSEHLIEIPQ